MYFIIMYYQFKNSNSDIINKDNTNDNKNFGNKYFLID
jgi:hypothetical protein